MSVTFLASWLPSPEQLAAYEHLGAIGILIGILIVLLTAAGVVTRSVFGWLVSFGKAHLNSMGEQTEALREVRDGTNEMRGGQRDLHRRLDAIFQCGAPACPVRASRIMNEGREISARQIHLTPIPKDSENEQHA